MISVSFISSKSQHGSAVPHGRLSPTHLLLLLRLHLCRFLAFIDTSEYNHAHARKYPSTPPSAFSTCRGSSFSHYPFFSFQSSPLVSHSVSSPFCSGLHSTTTIFRNLWTQRNSTVHAQAQFQEPVQSFNIEVPEQII